MDLTQGAPPDPVLGIEAMAASKQDVYFIAIRMQVGAVRRELPLVGLGEQASEAVLFALECVEAEVQEWHASGLVAVAQLQALLAALMKLPGELRRLQEAGEEGCVTPGWLEEFGVIPGREPGPPPGAAS